MYEDILYKPIKTKDEINQLIRENQGLVYYMLTQLGQLDNPDAEEAAWDALWDAVVKFDIFSTYQFSLLHVGVLKIELVMYCDSSNVAAIMSQVYQIFLKRSYKTQHFQINLIV